MIIFCTSIKCIYLITRLYSIRSESRFQLMPAGHVRSTNLSYILPPSFTQPNRVRFFPLCVKPIDVLSARSIINLSWDRFLRAAFDRKPIVRRGRLLSETPSVFLFQGIMAWKAQVAIQTTFISRDTVKVERNARWI